MKSRRNLMMGLISLALLAAPISASAKDNDSSRDIQQQSQSGNEVSTSHSNSAPARSNARERNVAPAPMNREASHQDVTRSESRGERGIRTTPAVEPNRDSRDYRGDGNRWNRDHDRDYRNYGDRDYDSYAGGTPYYVMPRGYSGGACAWARHIHNVYERDLATGHPAAASDLLGPLHRAERACGGLPYGYGYYR